MMKRLLASILLVVATRAMAGPGDIPVDTGSIATAGVFTVLMGPFSGPIAQVDVSVPSASTVSVDVATSATSGTKVAKSILASGAITASRSYHPRVYVDTAAGGSITNAFPAEIWLAEDWLRITVSNKNPLAGTTSRVTIVRGGQPNP